MKCLGEPLPFEKEEQVGGGPPLEGGKNQMGGSQGGDRHDICQFFYTTGVFEARILPQKARKSRQWQIYDKTA